MVMHGIDTLPICGVVAEPTSAPALESAPYRSADLRLAADLPLAHVSASEVPRRSVRGGRTDGKGSLSPQEQLLLVRSAVFFSGWTLPAAQEVCSDRSLPRAQIEPLVLQLVKTAEVCTEDSQGTIRYHLADAAFWRTRLYASEEREALCQRHRDYYLQWVALSARPPEGIKAAGWLEQLKSEYDNLWAALLWSWREKDTEAVLSLVNTLYALLRRPAT